jgi:GTP pyrophosphokinase
MKLDTADDFYAALGAGALTMSQVVNALSAQELKPQQVAEAPMPEAGPGTGVEVLGVGDLLTRMARCCTPIRGDEITGYITRGRGVTVHRRSCPNILNESEKERLVHVNWGKTHSVYPVRIRLEAWDRVGLLSDVTSLVSGERMNIASCVSEEEDDTSIISLTVYIEGIDQLSRLFSKLERVDGVMRIARSTT